MAPMARWLAAPVVALCACAVASGAVNPEQLRLQRSLKADMAKSFKKRAPSLEITTVSCKLPVSGTVAHCTAHFVVGQVKGYYKVSATIHESGQLTWTAASPRCFDAKSGKALRC